MAFPGATAGPEGADYAVVGAPLDVSTTFRPGARFGPDRVRQFAEPFEDYDRRTGARFSALGVHDAGDVRAWADAADYLDHLESSLADFADAGTVPLVVGGEHTVTVAAVRAVEPEVYVCVDAHLDLRDEFDGDPLSHACTTRRVLDVVDEAVILGARSGSEAGWARAEAADVTPVAPGDVAAWRPSGSRRTYLSVDIDGADPGVAPGTGTMEPFGLDAATVRDAVRRVAPTCVGFDVVEVNDRDNGEAAALGAKLLREFVFAHAAA